MNRLTLALASAASLALVACGGETEETVVVADTAADPMAMDPAANTVVAVAQGNPDLSTLVTAVNAADLGETLSGAGPYTVFAPNNAAFEELPAGTLDELTTTNTDQLSNILQYHVVSGETMAAGLTQAIEGAGPGGYTIPTVGGGSLTAMLEGGQIVLTDAAGNTATVVQADVDASNGVVHVIDGVLMPE